MKAIKSAIVLASLSLFALACSYSVGTGSSNDPASAKSPAAANAPATPAAPADELASAKKIYADKCIRCHKEDGKGGITDIDGEKIKAPDFTTEKMKKHEDAEFVDIIENGESDDGMPAFKGKLSEQEIKDLVRLIRRDFQGIK